MKILRPTFKEKKFRQWLIKSGAEILSPTNQYELLRFKAFGTIRVIYINTKDQVNFQHGSDDIYSDFLQKKTVNLCEVKKRLKRNSDIPTLIERDGEDCFFCLNPLKEDITVEHIVPVSRGGNNHISNKVLAHKKCNQLAGNMTVIEKVKLREQHILGAGK